METGRFDKILDYFPLISYISFWLQGALLPSFMTEDPRLIRLGVVTLPALICFFIAALRLRSRHKKQQS